MDETFNITKNDFMIISCSIIPYIFNLDIF